MRKYKVAIVETGYKSYEYEKSQFKELNIEFIIKQCESEQEVIETAKDADGILVRHRVAITSKVINALEKCKIISRYGVGVDNINLNATTKKGIYVCNVPDYCWKKSLTMLDGIVKNLKQSYRPKQPPILCKCSEVKSL